MPEADPDLAVIDISLGGMDGIVLTRQLKETLPGLKVLVVSMHDESRYLEGALKAGASGYVLKDNVHRLLPEAAREVLGGSRYLDRGLKDKF